MRNVYITAQNHAFCLLPGIKSLTYICALDLESNPLPFSAWANVLSTEKNGLEQAIGISGQWHYRAVWGQTMAENDLGSFWKLSKFWINREVVESISVDIFTLENRQNNHDL